MACCGKNKLTCCGKPLRRRVIKTDGGWKVEMFCVVCKKVSE